MNIIEKIKNAVKPEHEWFRTYSLVSAVPIQSVGKYGRVVNWQSFAFDQQMYDTRKYTFAKAAMNILMCKAAEIIEGQVAERQAMNAQQDHDPVQVELPELSEYSVIRRSEHQYDLVRSTDKGDVVVLSATDRRC